MVHPRQLQPFRDGIIGLIVGSLGMAIAPPLLAQTPPVPIAQSSSLDGIWRLTVIGEPTSPGVVPQATELTAEFAGDRIFGSGGCNRFMGGFQTEGDQLTVGPLASALMLCEEPVMAQEARYLAALQGAQRYEVDGQNLTIFYETEQEAGVLRFTRQPVRGLW